VPITFTQEDFRLKSTNHNDAMVIEVNIAGWVIGKILVDNGSSIDILFLKTFEKMNLTQHMLHPLEYPLQGFGGKPIKPVGKLSLPVSFGDLDNARTETLTFDVVDISSISRDFWQRIHEQIRRSHKTTILMHEDTSAQRSYHCIERLARGSKHRKGSYPRADQRISAEFPRRKERTLHRG
jgi:hypothetical protein